MTARPLVTPADKPAHKVDDPDRPTLQEVKERLRESILQTAASIAEAAPPRPSLGELREAPWAVLDTAVERRGQSSLSGETGGYDFSGLTDQELAQEMLAEFPELLVEARRMLEIAPKDTAGP
jgi:hypothetical protein